MLLLVVGVLLSGCGSDDGIDYGGGHRKVKPDPQCGRGDSQLCDFEIELYCEYGAVSRAQLGGCLRNVTWGQFKYSDTNAARFARGDLGKCLADAGPFCKASSAEPSYDDYYGQ